MDQFNYLDAYHDAMAILRSLDQHPCCQGTVCFTWLAMVKWLARQHREIIYVHMNLFCCWKKPSHSISQW